MFEERKIKSIWFGELYAAIGKDYYGRNVKEIQQHVAQGDGDKWFYDILFENGEMLRTFNPSEVEFGEIIKRPF